MRIIILSLVLALTIVNYSPATTYYVKIGGNDSSAGTSWPSAWATAAKVQATLTGGDTVFFGTGTWYDVKFTQRPGATGTDRTCYACSSFVLTHPAKLYGGTQVTGWVLHSGSIYKARWVGSDCQNGKTCYTLGGENDSLLFPQTSLSAVNSVGKFYHNTSTDTLYAWLWNSDNPNNYNMVAACKSIFILTNSGGWGANYTTIFGLDLRFAKQGCIWLFGSHHPDSVFIDHCNISRVENSAGENPSGIFSDADPGTDTASYGHFDRVRACSLSNFINSAWDHGSGTAIYSEHRMAIESCYVTGPCKVGIEFKGQGAASITSGNVIRYNTVKRVTVHGITVWEHPDHDSIYGNIVIGDYITDRGIQIAGTAAPAGRQIIVFNNTIYHCHNGMQADDDQTYSVPDRRFKYNIIDMGTGTSVFERLAANQGDWTIDSNLYWDANGYDHFMLVNTAKTLAQWRALGFDVHSTTGADPGFNNPAGGDFSRTSSSQDTMDMTYGGKHWTRYGAWQPNSSTPHISENKTNLAFTAFHNGPMPDSQTFTITNTGGGTLNWSVSDNMTWLDESPTAGNNNFQTVKVSVNATNLNPGTYNATIRLSSSNADNSPQTISVTYSLYPDTLSPPVPISPANGATIGATNPTLIIDNGEGNSGSSLLYLFEIDSTTKFNSPMMQQSTPLALGHPDDSTTSWIVPQKLDSAEYFWRAFAYTNTPPFETSAASQVFHFRDTTGLSPPHMVLSLASLSFSAVQNGSLPVSQTFTITNSGGGTLNWSVSDNAAWLDESPTSGNSNSATITVSVNTTNLTPQTYSAIITVSSSNADNSPQTIPVTYTLSPRPPHIALDKTSLSFGAVQNGSLPDSQTFTIANSRGGTLNWSVLDNAAWLDESPTSGNSNSQTITVSVDTTNLTPQTYSAIITVSSSNADNSPQTIPVTYTVVSPNPTEPVAGIRIFPNPFIPAAGHSYVTFHNIPLNSKIIIATVSGELVKTFKNTQQIDIIWDAKNENQRELASGAYLYEVYNTGRRVGYGKFVVIR